MSESENGSATGNSDDDIMNYLRSNMMFYTKRTMYTPAEKCVVPLAYRRFQQRIRNLEVHEDDIWVMSFPRCGATWTVEMIWLLVNNLDYKGAEVNILERVPFLECDMFAEDKILDTPDAPKPKFDTIDTLPRPRIIRTHLPLELLPAQLETKKPKIVFILRNSMDVAVSYYYMSCIFFGYTGTMGEFFKGMRAGLTVYGCFWRHAANLWKIHHQPNVLYLTYEEMIQDLSSVIWKTAKFLDRSIRDEQMAQLMDHLSFSKMRINEAVNLKSIIKKTNFGISAPDRNFIRKGICGEHKTVMSEETVKQFEEWNFLMKKKLGLSDDPEFPL